MTRRVNFGVSLGKSVSPYPIEQVRGKANVRVDLQSEVQAVHGDDHLIAIDVIDRASVTVHRRDCGGLLAPRRAAASARPGTA